MGRWSVFALRLAGPMPSNAGRGVRTCSPTLQCWRVSIALATGANGKPRNEAESGATPRLC